MVSLHWLTVAVYPSKEKSIFSSQSDSAVAALVGGQIESYSQRVKGSKKE